MKVLLNKVDVNVDIPSSELKTMPKTGPPAEFFSGAFQSFIDMQPEAVYGVGQVNSIPVPNKFKFEDLGIDFTIPVVDPANIKFHFQGSLDDYPYMSKEECFAWADELGITDLRGSRSDAEKEGGCITNAEKTMMHYNPAERSCVSDIFMEKSSTISQSTDNHLLNVSAKECEEFAKGKDYRYVGASYFDDRPQGCVHKDDEVYFNRKTHRVNKTEAQLKSFAEFTGVQKKVTYEQNICGGSVGGNYDCRLSEKTYYCSAGNDEKLGTYAVSSEGVCVDQCTVSYGSSRTGIKCQLEQYHADGTTAMKGEMDGEIYSSIEDAKKFCDENNNCVAIAQSENEFWPVRSTDNFLPCDAGDSCDPQINYLKREDAKRDVLCMEKDRNADNCLRTRRDLMRSPYTFSPIDMSKYAYTAKECEEKAEQMKKDGYDIEFTSPLTTFTSNGLPPGCQTLMEGGKKTVQFNTTGTKVSRCTRSHCNPGDKPYNLNSECCSGTLGSYTEAECKKWTENQLPVLGWKWEGSGNWNDRPYGCVQSTGGGSKYGNSAYFNKTQTDISCDEPLDWKEEEWGSKTLITAYSCIKKCSGKRYSCPNGRFGCRPHDDQTYCIFPKDTRKLCSEGRLCLDWLRRENQRKNNACSFLGHVDEEKIMSSQRYEDTSEMAWVCCSRNLVGTCKTYRMGGGQCFPDHDTTVDYVLNNKPDMTLNSNRNGWRNAVSSTMWQCAVPSYTETSSGKSDETILSTECRRVAKQYNDLEWSGDNNFLSDSYPYGCFYIYANGSGKVYYNKKQDSPKNCSSSHKCFKRKKACTDKIVPPFLESFYYDIVKTQILNSPALESQDDQYCINSINMFGDDDPDISCEKICCPQHVKSGTPNLSVSKSDCKDYAENIGYTWGGNSNDGNVKGCFAQHGAKAVYYNEKNTSTKCQDVSVSTCVETVDSRVESWWPEKAVSMKTITKKDACDPELLCCKNILGNPDKQNCPVGIQPDYYNEPTLCWFGVDECKGEAVAVSTACCKDIFGNTDRNNCPSSCTCERKCTRDFFGNKTCEYKCSDGSCPYGCRNK